MEFEHSQFGYWITYDSEVIPLTSSMSHEEHKSYEDALKDNWIRVSIYGKEMSISEADLAIPMKNTGILRRMAKIHDVEAIYTEHHGHGKPMEVFRRLNKSSFTGNALKSLKTYRNAHSKSFSEKVDLSNPEFNELMHDLFIGIKNYQTFLKKSHEVMRNEKASPEEKLNSLDFYLGHEMNRTMHFVEDVLDKIEDKSRVMKTKTEE